MYPLSQPVGLPAPPEGEPSLLCSFLPPPLGEVAEQREVGGGLPPQSALQTVPPEGGGAKCIGNHFPADARYRNVTTWARVQG